MREQKNIRLIVIEKSAAHAELIYRRLRKARYYLPRPRSVTNNRELKDALSKQEWDLIISVSQVGDFSAIQVCKTVSSSQKDVPVIVLFEEPECQNNEECEGIGDFFKDTVELLKAGAAQVIPKTNDDYLYIIVSRVLRNLEKRRQSLQLEKLYTESQEQNKMLLESSREAIAYVVHDGLHLYANPSYLKMFAYDDFEELEMYPIMDLVSDDDYDKFHSFWRSLKGNNASQKIKLEGVKSNQELFKMTMEVRNATYDGEDCIRIIVRDQSQNEQWKILDSITGLFNSQHFTKLVNDALVKVRETQIRSVLFYIELDDFDSVKDRIGVASFDPVIKKISKVIKSIYKEKEAAIARFSESVFTLLIEDKDGDKYAGAIEFGKTICKAVEDYVIELENTQFFLTCSIGIAQVFASTPTAAEVLNDASEACQKAMKEGGNRVELYKPVITNKTGGVKNAEIAQLIETAAEENRLSLRYQPVVSLHGETLELYEVLLRMVDSEGKFLPSSEIFEVAEDSDLSLLLDKWIIKTAINTLQAQEKNGYQTHFFIKLSKQVVKTEEILFFIRECIKSTNVPAERLIFEIKADVAIEQVTMTQKFIKLLHTFKCKTALEKFKTGNNYETILKHLPVDYVKIDASYSQDLSDNEENQQAMEEIISLAHELKILTVSVAIEDADSLASLWSYEADFAQGYIIQEPLEVLEFDFSA
jgi:diguanylate cyclase (GGDEF)-like protein/PAS domain S-box-containing protein